MKIGIPTEIKNNENRVAATPSGVHELVRRGHEVLIQRGAGVGSRIDDDAYAIAGAIILDTAADVWAQADLVLKVKEPIAAEFPLSLLEARALKAGGVLLRYAVGAGKAA